MIWKIGKLLAHIWIPLKCIRNNKNGTWKEGFGKNELIKQLERLIIKFRRYYIHLAESFQRKMIKCIENIGNRVLY